MIISQKSQKNDKTTSALTWSQWVLQKTLILVVTIILLFTFILVFYKDNHSVFSELNDEAQSSYEYTQYKHLAIQTRKYDIYKSENLAVLNCIYDGDIAKAIRILDLFIDYNIINIYENINYIGIEECKTSIYILTNVKEFRKEYPRTPLFDDKPTISNDTKKLFSQEYSDILPDVLDMSQKKLTSKIDEIFMNLVEPKESLEHKQDAIKKNYIIDTDTLLRVELERERIIQNIAVLKALYDEDYACAIHLLDGDTAEKFKGQSRMALK